MDTAELFELCKEVYKRKPEWETPDWFDLDTEDGSPEEYLLTYEDVTIGRGGEIKPNTCPFYTSDYLLEKLRRFNTSLMFEYFEDFVTALRYDENDVYIRREADTPLKALLKLTIALDDAGELSHV